MSRILSRTAFPLLPLFFVLRTSSLSLAADPNYDPPQPSAEFGTPEATSKIAAAAGFWISTIEKPMHE